MKISKKQRQLNYLNILKSLAELCESSEFSNISMSKLATASGISDAGIYKYFASKESLLTGYLETRIQLAIESAQEVNEYSQRSFTEKIQTLIEKFLESVEGEKALVSEVVKHLFSQPISSAHLEIGKIKRQYVQFISGELDKAIDKGEYQNLPFSGFICELIWDYQLGIIVYWLKDESELEANTSTLNELSVSLLSEFLKGAMLSKAHAIGSFLFREHVMSKLLGLKLGGVL